MSFFDNWKEYLIRAERERHSTACQAAYYWIIAKFNEAHWAEEINLTDSELMRLSQIRSSKTIADVKSRLKLSGLIDFRTSKYYGTTYKLVQLASTSWSDNQGKVQGKEQSKEQSKVQSKVQGKVQGKVPLIKFTPKITKEEDVKTEDTDSAGACVCEYGDLNSEIVETWQANGDDLLWDMAYSLKAFEEKYGASAVTKGIIASRKSLKGRNPTIPYLRGTLERLKEEGARNEGRQSDRVELSKGDRFDYRKRYDDL